ncbi:hypothetical protein DYB35_001069 [Aphanomyces astaci]|uniref:Uncharacterized protein n=1 Tax=Aphanomyces astaci TaxID=112090 RepID=A0A3R6ZQW0_APHAT|nr:hypothetical protein DYB35_001069 [Aphanomyces astaci]
MFDDIVILKNKKHVVIPEKMHGKTADAKGSKRRRTPPALPAGVKLINPHYSSGTDEDDMEEADAPVVGQGFPPSLRTLEKDTILMRKQYPGLDVQVIEQVLVDTIPKEQNQHSYNAILTEAAARLEKLHDDEDRPRTPTDFRDMSKREREVRAKMVLDPLSHKAETFLTGVDTGQYDMFLPFIFTRVHHQQTWRPSTRRTDPIDQGTFSPFTLDRCPRSTTNTKVILISISTFMERHVAAKVEVHKVRLKQHWHLQYAQHIHSIAKDQQEFAQHMLAALKGRHPNRKMYMDEKRVAMERKKKTTAQDEEVLRMKQQKDAAALRDLKDEIAMRNLAAKHKKSNAMRSQHTQSTCQPTTAPYKLDEPPIASSPRHLEQARLPLTHRKLGAFRTSRRGHGNMQKYILNSPDRPKAVFGGGFRTEPKDNKDDDHGGGSGNEDGGRPLILLAEQLPLHLQSLTTSTS